MFRFLHIVLNGSNKFSLCAMHETLLTMFAYTLTLALLFFYTYRDNVVIH